MPRPKKKDGVPHAVKAEAKARLNIRAKGAAAERAVVAMFVQVMEQVEAELGVDGVSAGVKRNSLQSDRGGNDIHGVPGLSIEVKRQERLSLGTWWQQCTKQAGPGELPVLIWRQSHQPWSVRTYACLAHVKAHKWVVSDMTIEDFLNFYKLVYYNWLVDQKLGAKNAA